MTANVITFPLPDQSAEIIPYGCIEAGDDFGIYAGYAMEVRR